MFVIKEYLVEDSDKSKGRRRRIKNYKEYRICKIMENVNKID